MRDFLLSLPKTETHLHVEGALPYELLTQWNPEQWPPDPQFRSPTFRYPSFPDFERILLDNALPWFTTPERYHEAAKVMFAKHVAQNVRYVEASFHLPVTTLIKTPGTEIIAALRSAAPEGLEVRIFAGMARSDIEGELSSTIEELHKWEGLAGVDLHGHEVIATPPATAKIWARIRAAGKVTKAHAGEFDGPERVREAIEVLGVDRIQHGVRAIEDPAVVRLAAERRVTFDVCPISNVRLQVVPSMKQHPIRRLMKAGIRCTVSTDDPLCFGNTVIEEYETLADELTFSRRELAELAKNGWEVADVPASTRKTLIAEIDRITATTP